MVREMKELVVNLRSGKRFDVRIDRATKWGNPFSHKQGTKAEWVVGSRQEAIDAYREWMISGIKNGRVDLDELIALEGKVLACWCKPLPCHGDVLVRLIEYAKAERTMEHE